MRRFQPGAEPLDIRCLPAAGVAASLAGGILRIEGTDLADSIQVAYRAMPSNPRFGGAGAAIGFVTIDGSFRSPLVRFSGIIVNAHGGDDTIVINQLGPAGVPIGIDGGAGNDTIRGGPAGEVLVGGDGDDTIWGGGGPDTIIGGPGRNTINGVTDPLPPPPAQVIDPPVVVPPPVDPPPVDPPITPGADLNAFAADIVVYANAERAKVGLAPLRVNSSLNRMAQIHAEAMARFDRMEHTLPAAEFPTLRDRATHVGYRFAQLGENIAFNFREASSLTFAWMSSPGHRDNILNPGFTEIGVGLARNSKGELFIAQVLGRPA